MNSRRLLIALIAVVAVAVLAWWRWAGAAPEGPLAGSGIGGAFELIDQDGRAVSDKSFADYYLLVYFGYTFCPDICPLDAQKLASALKSFEASDPERAAKVQPLFITIDPERDTPAALKQFVGAFHPRLVGLTGTAAQVDAAKKAYKAYGERAGPAGAKDYLMDHSSMIYLIGLKGKPISFVTHDQSAAALAAQLERYVR